MTAPTPFAAWIAEAKAGVDQGALSTRDERRDLTTALAMLEIAHEGFAKIAEHGGTSGLAETYLDRLDVLARGKP